MAKDNRFPSPANVSIDKAGKAPQPKAEAPAPATVIGKKDELVAVQYTGQNAVMLHNGVHSIIPGLNQIGKSIWEEAKKLPNIIKLLKDGALKIHGSKDMPAEEAEKEEPKKSEEEKSSDEKSA